MGTPPTITNLTGKGRHLLFAHPGQGVSPKVRIAPMLDVRGDGSYIVAPPSLHHLGRRYRWAREHGLGPRECDPAPLPAALLAKLTSPASESSAARPARAIALMTRIPEGERDATLTAFAGRMFGKGHPADEVLALALALNATSCKPPLPVKDVERIVNSIGRAEARKPTQAIRPSTAPPYTFTSRYS